MKSNNPVFNRSPEFSGQSTNAYGNQTYPANGAPYGGYGQQQGYSDPSTWGTGTPGTPTQVDQGRMTVDTVVQKTAISLVFVFAAAGFTWFMTPEISSTANLGPLYLALMVGSLGAFGLSLVQLVQARDQPGPGAGVLRPRGCRAGCAEQGVRRAVR